MLDVLPYQSSSKTRSSEQASAAQATVGVPQKSPAVNASLEIDDSCKLLIINGRRGGDRTHNPRLRRPVLYPIELLAHIFYCSFEAARAGWSSSRTNGTNACNADASVSRASFHVDPHPVI
jgi:hypothetical protein